jgi:hypothetical protein
MPGADAASRASTTASTSGAITRRRPIECPVFTDVPGRARFGTRMSESSGRWYTSTPQEWSNRNPALSRTKTTKGTICEPLV